MGPMIDGYNINDGRMEPLSLGILAGLTPHGHEVKLYDDRMETIPFDEQADLVGITVDSFTASRAYQISDEYRKRNIPVVLGGVHVTLLPDEASTHADAIVIGDAETVWQNVLADISNGKLQKKYTGTFDEPQKDAFPRRDLFKGKGYLPVSMVQFSRGCCFDCSYCSVSKFFKRSHQCRNIESVIEEIEKDKLKQILFVDDNMVANRKWLKLFLKELAPLKVNWASQSSIDMVQDRELMDLMAKSGCIGHLIGFESININTLKWINKSPNIRNFDEYRKALDILRDYNLLTWASFMIGNDFDDLETIEKTVEFAIKSKFTLAFFHVLMPYPGTEVYEQFKNENRLLYDGHWWDHEDYTYNSATFVPKLISPEQLKEAAIKANKAFYSYSSIASRMFDFKTNFSSLINLFIYSKFNYILRSTST